MFLRYQFNVLFQFLKQGDYSVDDLDWLNDVLVNLMDDTTTALGIPLQICDVFLPELCNIDGEKISFETIAKLLSPFLHTAAKT